MDTKTAAIEMPIFFTEDSHWLADALDAAPALWGKICGLADDYEDNDESDFSVLHEGRRNPVLPFVIWVHPGDACESDCGNAKIADASLELQAGMAKEMKNFGPCDVVVLHRYSSKFAFEHTNRVHDDYFQAMMQCLKDDRATHVFGDDLAAAAEWMLSKLAIQQRPDVLLTGAWSHPEWGCVSAIGKSLHAAGAENLRVSWASPSDPGTVSGAWHPPSSNEPAHHKRQIGPR